MFLFILQKIALADCLPEQKLLLKREFLEHYLATCASQSEWTQPTRLHLEDTLLLNYTD